MLNGKRGFLAYCLDRAGIVSASLALRGRVLPARLTALTYHRVDYPEQAADFDEDVLDATPESFDRHIALFRKHWTIVSLAELQEFLRGVTPPPNPLLLTFDDGYRGNHEYVLPILQRYAIKASFFIATDYVTHRRVFWWDRISWTLKHATRSKFTLPYPIHQEIDLTAGAREAARRLHRLVKSWQGLDLPRFLGELSEASGSPWSEQLERELAEQLIMNWDQVAALSKAGMYIGSHTRSHRVLQTLRRDELEAELGGSRRELELRLGEPVRAVAYPCGQRIDPSSELRTSIKDAGYDFGFSYLTGAQSLRQVDPLDIRRLGVERGWSDQRLRASLCFTWLACP